MKRKNILWWLGLVAALVLINLVASKFHVRADLTEEKRYSLTQTTKDLARSLSSDVIIEVFLKGDFPAGFKKLSSSTEEFLNTLKDQNPAHIQYRLVSPEETVGNGRKWGDSLQLLGATPLNLQSQVESGQQTTYVYPVARVSHNGQSQLVSLYQGSTSLISNVEVNNAEVLLEYQFAKALENLANPNRPFIGYLVGNGEPTGPETFDLQQTIRSSYPFFTVDIDRQFIIPDTMKALIIVKPTIPFSEAQKLKIDQYIMRGGKVMWFIDNLNAELDSLSIAAQLIAYDRNLNLQDLLFTYGARINSDLLMDFESDFLPFQVGGSSENPQMELLQWNYYPVFSSKNNHSINRNLGLVLGRFVNSIDTIETEGIVKTPLLQSSPSSRLLGTPALISPKEVRNTPDDKLFDKSGISAAVLLEGKFTSLYKGRISKSQRDSFSAFGGYRELSSDNKMVIVSDGDLILNDFSFKDNQPLPMGRNIYTLGTQASREFANRNFLINTLEYLTTNSKISETRNKEIVLRLLDTKKVEAEKGAWQLITIALPIVLVILFGVAYGRIRRYRFASA